jgi:hypothetical protein
MYVCIYAVVDQNFSLFNYVSELNVQVEKLEEHLCMYVSMYSRETYVHVHMCMHTQAHMQIAEMKEKIENARRDKVVRMTDIHTYTYMYIHTYTYAHTDCGN